MLFISSSSSSSVGHKRNYEKISCLAQLSFLILCFLVSTNKAGVIKKRDIAVTLTQNGNTVKETEEDPTILTVLNNTNVIANTKLQNVTVDQHVAAEASKELTNNEILINEAKNLLEEENKIKKTINETESKMKNGGKGSDETRTAAEFSSNAIKDEKILKFTENQDVNVTRNKDNAVNSNNSSSLVNTLQIADENSKPTGKILTDLNTHVENSAKDQNKQLDNNIENSKEYIRNDLQSDNNEKPINKVIIKPLELTSKTSNNKDSVLPSKTSGNTYETPLESSETSTSVPMITDSLQVSKMSTRVPPIDSKSEDEIKSLESLTKEHSDLRKEHHSNQIYDILDSQELMKTDKNQTNLLTTPASLISRDGTTLNPIGEQTHISTLEHNKQEYARSMFMEETTTINFRQVDEVTTFKPVILSIKDGIEENVQGKLKDDIEDSHKNHVAPLNVKEKKPKFISDNSTNAQQLNLPNNAEAWSLASMKSLPKANITIETAQTHNQTKKELMELHNTSLSLNNNSEKNLLDWSQIMMDKELSTTARNEDNKNKKLEKTGTEDLESVVDTTTLMPLTGVTHFKMPPGINVITQNSLIEQEATTTTTVTPVSTSTILSPLIYNENDNKNSNQPDKKVEENMNNHIDTLTATLATITATNVDNNPFNTSLNIEPNLNEINLTSNQTQTDLNNDVHTKTTAGKESFVVNDDVNANTDRETSTVAAAMTATTTTTSEITKTKSTAVVEQISSETTTVSTLETSKQNTSPVNGVAISEQQQQQNKNNTSNVINQEQNISLSASHNELENTVANRQTTIQYENIDLNTKSTTTTSTVVPITTFRPTILAITSTTSIPATFEQEVDQNTRSNEIQTNLSNTEQHSIIETGLHRNHSTKAIETQLTAREFETTTLEIFTSTTTAAPELTTGKIENTLHASSLENETSTTTTSSSIDEITNETTEINLNTIETTTPVQTTPKQVLEEDKNTGDAETTSGSSVSEDQKFEKESKTATTTEINISTETPVVIKSVTSSTTMPTTIPLTITTATTTVTKENTIATTTAKQESDTEDIIPLKENAQIETTTTIMNNIQEIATSTFSMPSTTFKEEETYISLLDDTSTTTQTYSSTISTASTSHAPINTTTTTTTTTTLLPPASSSTLPSAITTKVEEIYNVINSTTTELVQTTTQQLLTEIEEEASAERSSTTTTSSTQFPEMLPPPTTTQSNQIIDTADIGKSLPTLTSIMGGNSGNMYPKNTEGSGETDVNAIIAITVSVIGVIALVLLVGFLYLMRKRQKQTSYSQRCRPVSLDEYTIDNASVSGSMRKSSALRASKRTYGNLAFDDPALRPNPMGVQELSKFVQEKLRIFEEFRDVPQITSRLDEVPTGCEDKNRYANVLPLPETRVILQRLNDDEKSEYINANYVTGPKDPPNYYIACQAPLESTVEDFWRMIWEQQSRVIIQATDLIENGVEKCAEYLPPSATLDNHSSFGDFQITLQNREVKDKYAISTILLKHVGEDATRELTHYWYKWPEVGVPTEEAPIIAMLLEARSSLISYAIEQANEDKEKLSTGTLKAAEESTATANDSSTLPANNSNGSIANANTAEINGNISMVHIKKATRNQGPLTIHCSPGTGRTGTIIACDIAIRSLETPKRIVDIPQIVYYVRRGRASAVLTKEQYEFIYKVASMYAAKITNPTNYH